MCEIITLVCKQCELKAQHTSQPKQCIHKDHKEKHPQHEHASAQHVAVNQEAGGSIPFYLYSSGVKGKVE